jgi:hypothetical protein
MAKRTKKAKVFSVTQKTDGFRDGFKRKVRAKQAARLADAMRTDGANTAVRDALTGTDRRGGRVYEATFVLANDTRDPRSMYTREQVYDPDPETWAALVEAKELVSMGTKGSAFFKWSPHGFLTFADTAKQAEFMLSRRGDGKWVAYKFLRDGTLALVRKAEGV